MPQRSGLGKGLDALIPSSKEGEGAGGVTHISIDRIVPNPRQPRTNFDATEMEELAASIREHGVIQPLIVTQGERGKEYVLVAGERRWQAAKLAGLRELPVVVRQATDQQRLELALIENLQRADLNPLEEANAYNQLVEEFSLSHDEIAARVGKNRVTVTNTLRLLKLPEIVQAALSQEKITAGHGRALLGLASPQAQIAALQTVLKNDYNVRQTEELVRRLSGQKTAAKNRPAPPPEMKAIEERLQASLGTKVALKKGRKGGSLVLYYYSDEELNAILDRLIDE